MGAHRERGLTAGGGHEGLAPSCLPPVATPAAEKRHSTVSTTIPPVFEVPPPDYRVEEHPSAVALLLRRAKLWNPPADPEHAALILEPKPAALELARHLVAASSSPAEPELGDAQYAFVELACAIAGGMTREDIARSLEELGRACLNLADAQGTTLALPVSAVLEVLLLARQIERGAGGEPRELGQRARQLLERVVPSHLINGPVPPVVS